MPVKPRAFDLLARNAKNSSIEIRSAMVVILNKNELVMDVPLTKYVTCIFLKADQRTD